MTDQLNSQNLVPFRKRRGAYHIPGMTGENEHNALEVDPNLDPEEERYIRHYLGYADVFLKNDADVEDADVEFESQAEAPAQKALLADSSAADQPEQTEQEGNSINKAA